MYNNDENYVYQQQAKQKRLPFGQEPFTHPSRQDMYDEERKNQEAADYLYVQKRREKQGAPQKDPDVWDPPSPKDDRGKIFISL